MFAVKREKLGLLRELLGKDCSSSVPHLEQELDTMVEQVTLSTPNNKLRVVVCNLGATVTSIRLAKHSSDVIVMPNNWYLDGKYYAGRTCGRMAGRVGDYEGARHQAFPLHGGKVGFSHRVWRLRNTIVSQKSAMVCFELDSADMEQGHPGAIRIELNVICTHSPNTNAPSLILNFRAKLLAGNGGAVVNPTHHMYFASKAPSSTLWMPRATRYIPNHFGVEPIAVSKRFDYQTDARELDVTSAELDHCFILDAIKSSSTTITEEGGEAVVRFSTGKLLMVIHSTFPAIVVYTNGELGAVCFEAQFPPNCVNMNVPQYEHRFRLRRVEDGFHLNETTVHEFYVND